MFCAFVALIVVEISLFCDAKSPLERCFKRGHERHSQAPNLNTRYRLTLLLFLRASLCILEIDSTRWCSRDINLKFKIQPSGWIHHAIRIPATTAVTNARKGPNRRLCPVLLQPWRTHFLVHTGGKISYQLSRKGNVIVDVFYHSTRGRFSCLLYTSPSPRDGLLSRMPSSA